MYIYFQERIQLETARLYKLAGINPLAGLTCTFFFRCQSFLWLIILVVHPYTWKYISFFGGVGVCYSVVVFLNHFYLLHPGCLPTLATIPIWIGLYRALSNVANEVKLPVFTCSLILSIIF